MKTRKLSIASHQEYNDKNENSRKTKSSKLIKVKKDSKEESYRDTHNIGRRKSNSSVVTYSLNSHLFFDVYAKFDQQNCSQYNGANKVLRKSNRSSSEKRVSGDSEPLRSPTIEDVSTDAMSNHDGMSDKSSPKRLKVLCEAQPVREDETLIPSPQMDTVSPFRPPRPIRSSFPEISTQLSSSAISNNHSSVTDVPSTNTETFQKILENKTVFKKHLSKVMPTKKTVPKLKPRTKNKRTALMRLCKVTNQPLSLDANGESEQKQINKSRLLNKKKVTTRSRLKKNKVTLECNLPPREKRMASLNAAAIINCVQSLFSDRRRSLSKSDCIASSDNTEVEEINKMCDSPAQLKVDENYNETKHKHTKESQLTTDEKGEHKTEKKLSVSKRRRANSKKQEAIDVNIDTNKTVETNDEKVESQKGKNISTRKCNLSNKFESAVMDSKSDLIESDVFSKSADSIVKKNAYDFSDDDSKEGESIVNRKSIFSKKMKTSPKKKMLTEKLCDIKDELSGIKEKVADKEDAIIVDKKDDIMAKSYSSDHKTILKPDIIIEKQKKVFQKSNTSKKEIKDEKKVERLKETNETAKGSSKGNSNRFFDITTPVSQKERQKVAVITKRLRALVADTVCVTKENEEKEHSKANKNGQMPKKTIKKEEDHKPSEEVEDNAETPWLWEGEGREQPILLQLAGEMVTRVCYPAIRHAKDDVIIRVSDSVMLRSADQEPYLAKITAFFFDEESGKKMMAVLWYYRPEHTDQGRLSWHSDADVYASRHLDTNLVDCIEDKAFVLPVELYSRFMAYERRQACTSRQGLISRVVPLVSEEAFAEEARIGPGELSVDIFASDFYFCPTFQSTFPAEMTTANVFVCRGLYDLDGRRVVEDVVPLVAPLRGAASVDSAMSISSCASSPGSARRQRAVPALESVVNGH